MDGQTIPIPARVKMLRGCKKSRTMESKLPYINVIFFFLEKNHYIVFKFNYIPHYQNNIKVLLE